MGLETPAETTALEYTRHKAISMFGQPKHDPEKGVFPYVLPNAKYGGTVRVGVHGTFESLNPFIVRGLAPEGQQIFVFERLFDRSADEVFSLYGRIAESMDIAKDKSWLAVNLRPAARFHDRSPITADDVVFSFEKHKTSGRPHMRAFFSKVEKVEKTGNHRVVFYIGKQDRDDRDLPMLIAYMPVFSKQYYAAIPFDKPTLTPPLGSGPYTVSEVTPGRRIRYMRDKNYWGKHLIFAKGQYLFDEIVFDYYRDDMAAFELFKAGGYDLWEEKDPARWKRQYNFPALKQGSVKQTTIPARHTVGMHGFVFNTRRSLFRDVRVRQAIANAFDHEWLSRNYFHGGHTLEHSFFAAENLSTQKTQSLEDISLLKAYGFNPGDEGASAKTLSHSWSRDEQSVSKEQLKKAGWIVQDTKLVNEKTGEPFVFEILIALQGYKRLAAALAQNLQRLGIQVKIRQVDPSLYEHRVQSYDYDMVIANWQQTRIPGQEQCNYWGSKAAIQSGSRNYAGIKDNRIDCLIQDLSKERDESKYYRLVRGLDYALQQGFYVIPLPRPKYDLLAYKDRFDIPKTYPSSGFSATRWWSLMTWSVK